MIEAMNHEVMSKFASDILVNKNYLHVKSSGHREDWKEASGRVVRNVMTPYMPELVEKILPYVESRKFVPGGRYMYAAGRKYHQCNNCLSGDTRIITRGGTCSLLELEGKEVEVINRFGEWEPAIVRAFGRQQLWRVCLSNGDVIRATKDHRWWQSDGTRVTTDNLKTIPNVNRLLPSEPVMTLEEDIEEEVYCCVVPTSESFTLWNGLITSNCFIFTAEDAREGPGGWADTMKSVTSSLMTGGGVGVVYSKLRREGATIAGLGGTSTGPLALMQMVNECGRYIVQGGSRRSAIWAGLHWNHPDVFKFISIKNWSEAVKKCVADDFSFPAPMDGTNISVILDDLFFEAYSDPTHSLYSLACNVYWTAVRHMLRHGEPGFSIDVGDNAGEHGRNACTEVTSSFNGDMCNLGSINMARIESLDEMQEITQLATAFLLCGTLYSKLPMEYMYDVRNKTRRLGLGIMGVHEWLLKRGKRYEKDEELGKWLGVYAMSGSFANLYADRMSLSRPVATRAIAPTGTISIIGETTSGIEPLFAVAYKRRYLDGPDWKAQYVIPPIAKMMVDRGYDPKQIEDAFTLEEDIERRIEFQEWVQQNVDQGISSTLNLSPWGSSLNNEGTVSQFGNTMMKHLPGLRGITAYPNGARGGQPLVKVGYYDALKRVGNVMTESSDSDITSDDNAEGVIAYDENTCKDGVCGA